MKTSSILTDELFDRLVKDDRWLMLIADPVRHCNSAGELIGYHTCSYPVEYSVTKEQAERAKVLLTERRKAALEGIRPGELAFCSMGADTDVTEVGNHRLWVQFRNDKGITFFVELSLNIDNTAYYIGFAINRELEAEHDAECEKVYRWNTEHRNVEQHLKVPDQYYYLSAEAVKGNIGTRWQDVLMFINKTFGCSFTRARRFALGLLNAKSFVCVPE